jgi:predicted nucleotidyltransferase
MLAEDLTYFTSGNLYVIALGFIFPDLGTTVEKINAPVPESQLKRYEEGVYNWQVIEKEKLARPYKRNDLLQAVTRMAKKYGSLEEYKPVSINLSHEDRINIGQQIASELIKEPYTDSIHLIGSTASNSDKSDSDVDLLAVLRSCPGLNGHSKMDRIANHHPVDIFYMQQNEFFKAKNFQVQSVRDGILLASK